MSDTLPMNAAAYARDEHGLPSELFLELTVDDSETIAALLQHADGPDRDSFARRALRIGVVALGQARGQIDTSAVRHECQQMLLQLNGRLSEHANALQQRLSGTLHEYFNPKDGRFQERLENLIKRDGELEQVLRRQIGMDDSQLAKTLAAHFGGESPLMKRLSPHEAEGLLAALRETFGKQLESQREAVLKEFSLNNREGALARLVQELTTHSGKLTENLQGRIDAVVKEFSLDAEDSALSRLVKNVTAAQQTISSEFSLDNEQSALSRLTKMLKSADAAIHDNLTLDSDTSALARLKREIVTILDAQSKVNREFQEEVKVAVATITAKRGESHSTHHGLGFESVLKEFVQRECQRTGDLLEATGNKFGLLQRKIGDFVIELGPENVAAQAKIVVEAKEDKGYDLKKAQSEIDEARKNRDAKVGIFVFSRVTAPEGIERLSRIGNDVFVVWDYEDSLTDVFLTTAITLARALCVRAAELQDKQRADFSEVDEAILEIGKRSKSLEEISTWAQTIINNGEKIQEHVRKARKALESQCQTLTERVADLKELLAKDTTAV